MLLDLATIMNVALKMAIHRNRILSFVHLQLYETDPRDMKDV